jgi:hypothetical protein
MKDGERQVLCFILLAMLLSIIPTVKAWSRWDDRFAQIEWTAREANQWPMIGGPLSFFTPGSSHKSESTSCDRNCREEPALPC